MAIGVVTNESSLALVAEVTEGTYVAPSSGADYVEVLEGGLEFNKTREELERNLLSSTVEGEASRVGIADVTGTVNVELKANATEGDAPQSMDILMRSLLGGKRQITSDQTSGTSHTATRINFADTSDFQIGDCVLVKETGAFEVRPISDISANSYIEFPIALENGAPSDNVVVTQVTTYYHDTTNSITFSAEHNIGSEAIMQQVAGLRAVSASFENISVGQVPNVSFAVQGLDLDRLDQDASYSPTFSDGLPPVTLSSCAWIGGTKRAYTELTLNIENTVNYIQSACDEDGRIGSRITDQTVTAAINPYLDSSNLDEWNDFNNNDDTSLFWYSYNPTGTAGEFEEVVAFYLPQAKITAAPVADLDGIATQALEMKAFRSSGNDSFFISMI